VRTEDGRTVKMSELLVGESVLVRSADGELTYSKVYAFLDRKPEGEFDFVRLTVQAEGDSSAAAVLEVSPRHRVFHQGGAAQPLVDVDAADLRSGHLVQMATGSGAVHSAQILSVEEVRREGAYAPVTFAGTVVVDDVVASCYAMASHATAHAAFAPMRLAAELLPAAASTSEQIGLNWYAQMLLSTFGTFMEY
jgi:Hint module